MATYKQKLTAMTAQMTKFVAAAQDAKGDPKPLSVADLAAMGAMPARKEAKK